MKKQKGLTLVEMMVAILIASIVVLGMGAVLADAHKGYNKMYDRINSPVVQDAYAAKAIFDRIVRKASATIDPVMGTMSVKVYYYSAAGVGDPDRYAEFYVDGNDLKLDEGTHTSTSDTMSSTMVIAGNVQDDSEFFQKGACVQMILHLNNGKEDLVITCSSIRHNK
jgi:prepilin-type N-terminal cleavage/methylation domain-containing protein